MGASLSLSISESDLSKTDNTSKVTAKLYCHASGETWNGYSRSGSITIDGTKYSFSSSFKKGTTTLLATKSKTVKHDSDGGGKITVKGYYSTGVSAGNISTSKSYTLKTIERTYTIKYDANGGSGAPSSQTKTYGKNLTLSATKPSRTGYTFKSWNTKKDGTGTSYNSGATYSKNEAITLYAIWTEISAVVKFSTSKLPSVSSMTLYYSKSYNFPTIDVATANCGYHLKNWKANAIYYTPGSVLKSANVVPASTVYTAIEEANSSTITYKYKNTIDGSWRDGQVFIYRYDQTGIYMPDPVAVPEGFKFIGWNTYADYSGTMYLTSKSYRWVGSKNKVSSTGSFYAQYAEIDSYNIITKYIDDIDGTSISYASNIVVTKKSGQQFEFTFPTVESLNLPSYERGSTVLKPVSWYKISSPLTNPNYVDQGLLTNIVFPKSFNPVFENHYNAEYDLYEAGWTGTQVLEDDVSIYPVYIDMSASDISFVSSSYIYVDKVEGQLETSLEQYYAYIIGRSTLIEYAIVAKDYLAAFVFSSKSTVSVDFNSVKFYLSKNEAVPIEVTDYNIITRTLTGTSETYYYILISSQLDNDFETSNYRLTISNVFDSNGQEIESHYVLISPPDVVRDINANGKVVSYFKYATESPSLNNVSHELDVNGAVYAEEGFYGEYFNKDGEPIPSIDVQEDGIHSNLVGDVTGNLTGDVTGNVNAKNESETGLVESDIVKASKIEAESATLSEILETSDVILVGEGTGTGAVDQMVAWLGDSKGINISDIEYEHGKYSLVKIITELAKH